MELITADRPVIQKTKKQIDREKATGGKEREAARIRKGLPRVAVPAGCLRDFDGEIVQNLAATGRAGEDTAWPCFHTRIFRWREGSTEYGVIGGTIGAPFAVLVAEKLFALGCRALVSICSAGLADSLPVCAATLEAALEHGDRKINTGEGGRERCKTRW